MTGRALSQVHKLLFLIASKGRWRLVLPASDGRYATCVRAGPEMAAQQLARKARHILAEHHLEGLVIVAPEDELDTLRGELEALLVLVGVLAEDLYDMSDDELGHVLDRAIHAPWPER